MRRKREKLARDYKKLKFKLELKRRLLKRLISTDNDDLLSNDDKDSSEENQYDHLLLQYKNQQDIVRAHERYVQKYVFQRGDSWDRIMCIHAQRDRLPLSMKFYTTMLATKYNPGENNNENDGPWQ